MEATGRPLGGHCKETNTSDQLLETEVEFCLRFLLIVGNSWGALGLISAVVFLGVVRMAFVARFVSNMYLCVTCHNLFTARARSRHTAAAARVS